MCGILGALGERIVRTVADRFPGALETIAHRGPDGSGVQRYPRALLGHRRLAIIDTSEAGLQPMIDPESGLAIVFNGEIYNYIELRAELQALGHRFHTATDTECLLKGFLQWGPDLLSRCNGMWALVIWDERTQSAFMARDRFGVKPLLYAQDDQGIVFASEPKALHALLPQLTTPDEEAIVDLVVRSRLHAGARTLYRGMAALPPAHYAVFDAARGRLSLSRYWDYPEADASPDLNPDAFDALLDDAVRLRLRSDVPVGLTLSGGLDSSAVLAATVRAGHPGLTCFTSVYGQAHRGEERWARLAAETAGAQLQSVEARLDDWLPLLMRITHHLDGPGYSPAVFPLWAIMLQARAQGVPVLLEGQGADELLGGYPRYLAGDAIDHFGRGAIGAGVARARGLQAMSNARWAAAWLAREAAPRFSASLLQQERKGLFRREFAAFMAREDGAGAGRTPMMAVGESRLFRSLKEDHSASILPALLHYGDAISMAHGIESRLPFMDYRLVEWVFRKRPELLAGGLSKQPVRAYLQANGFAAIAARKDKLGYPTPLADWYATFGRYHYAEVVQAKNPLWEIFERAKVSALANKAARGSAAALFHMYKILTVELWLTVLKERRENTLHGRLQIAGA